MPPAHRELSLVCRFFFNKMALSTRSLNTEKILKAGVAQQILSVVFTSLAEAPPPYPQKLQLKLAVCPYQKRPATIPQQVTGRTQTLMKRRRLMKMLGKGVGMILSGNPVSKYSH